MNQDKIEIHYNVIAYKDKEDMNTHKLFESINPYQKEIDIFLACRELRRLYHEGKLEQWKIDRLNEIGFDWEENEL